MKGALLLIFYLIFLASCGEPGRGKRVQDLSPKLGATMEESSELSAYEKDIAYNICLAFRNKYTDFRNTRLGQKFSFEVKHTSCSGSTPATLIYTVLTKAAGENPLLSFTSSTGGVYFQGVESHLHGYLAPLCVHLLQGENAQNTYDAEDGKMQIKFFVDEGLAKFKASFSKRELNSSSPDFGKFMVTREDVLTVVGGSILPDAMSGLVSERVQTIFCSNGAYQELKQTFMLHQVQ